MERLGDLFNMWCSNDYDVNAGLSFYRNTKDFSTERSMNTQCFRYFGYWAKVTWHNSNIE